MGDAIEKARSWSHTKSDESSSCSSRSSSSSLSASSSPEMEEKDTNSAALMIRENRMALVNALLQKQLMEREIILYKIHEAKLPDGRVFICIPTAVDKENESVHFILPNVVNEKKVDIKSFNQWFFPVDYGQWE